MKTTLFTLLLAFGEELPPEINSNGSHLVPRKNFLLLHRSEAIRFICHGIFPFTPCLN